MIRRGPKAYDAFIDCLNESRHKHLADAVLENERDLRGITRIAPVQHHVLAPSEQISTRSMIGINVPDQANYQVQGQNFQPHSINVPFGSRESVPVQVQDEANSFHNNNVNTYSNLHPTEESPMDDELDLSVSNRIVPSSADPPKIPTSHPEYHGGAVGGKCKKNLK